METYGPILTVRQALELPVFVKARVAAGKKGLDNRIRWAHTIDIPDASYEWGRKGVLLLTAGYGLVEDTIRQERLVPKLVEQGFAGMVLSVGKYLARTPRLLRDAANQLNFPVIEVPGDVLFVDITEAIFERIINRQYMLLQKSGQIHAQLTELVLLGRNLTHLASTLANLLGRSITIEDPTFRVLATAQCGRVDEARDRSVERGRTTPELAQHLLQEGIYERLLIEMKPIYVPPMPELGMTMERIVTPIIVAQEIHGHIWIISGDHPLTDLDELAIAHGATVAALIMFKEQAVREVEEGLRGDFFEQLLTQAADSAQLAEQARQLNFHLNACHQVWLIHGVPAFNENWYSLAEAIEQWFNSRKINALVVWRDEGLVAVVENSDPEALKTLAESMVEELNHPVYRLLIGLGGINEPGNQHVTGIRRSYEEAREALRISVIMDRKEGVSAFDDLGVLHWLYHLRPEQTLGNVFLDYIRSLAEQDSKHNRELLKTLEVYLDHGGSLVDTSEALFMHRNTLLHRLERIQSLCSIDLRDPLLRFNLHTAIKYYRLHKD